MTNHIMLDLETMGTRPDAPIIAIGAVLFDEANIKREFYMNVDLESAMAAGAMPSAATILWWMRQSDDARQALLKDSYPIQTCLSQFTAWQHEFTYDGMWGNGVGFDNVILSESYYRLDMDPPWMFWQDRCYRTLKAQHPDIQMPAREGTHHNALDDAIHQAKHWQMIKGA